MTESFATPDEYALEGRASDLSTPLTESLGAQASEAFMGGTRTLLRGSQMLGAKHNIDPLAFAGAAETGAAGMAAYQHDMQAQAALPDVPIADAKIRVKKEGLEGHLKLPEQDSIRQPVLDLMLEHARERAQYEAAVNRGPQGFLPGALGFITQMGVGMIDPVNIAAFSIPVMGEARYGQMLARAGDSLLARAGVKAEVGAAQGAVGGTALLPADWWLRTQDGQDFTFADALKSVVLSAGMGAAFMGGHGLLSDIKARLKSEPLAGSPAAQLIAALEKHRPAAEPQAGIEPLGEEVPGIAAGEINAPAAISGAPGEGPGSEFTPLRLEDLPPNHPARILADLPPAVQENVVQAAMADMINGRPVRVGEMLNEAAKQDPRIAESLDLYHGSPHDFEAFSSEHIGSGEGAQSYGHGLYFAENRDVASQYHAKFLADQSKRTIPPEVMSALREMDYLGFENAREAMKGIRSEKLSGHDWKDVWDGHQPQAATHAKVIDNYLSADAPPKPASLYRVRINANKDHFLDWDKPLSEQGQFVQKALLEHPDPMIAGTAAKWGHDIPAMYSRIAQRLGGERELGPEGTKYPVNYSNEAKASAALSEVGIPGIKYLDQGSRPRTVALNEKATMGVRAKIASLKEELTHKDDPGILPAFARSREADIAALEKSIGENPTRNFVLFNDKLAEITHKNGEPVTPAQQTVATMHMRPRAGKGPRARDPDTYSLLEFLAANGGIRNDDALIADLRSSFGRDNKFVPGFGNLIRAPRELSTAAARGGQHAPMSLDHAREAAVEAGYLHDAGEQSGGLNESTINHLLEAVDQEVRGQRVYRAGTAPAAKVEAARIHEENQYHAESELDGALREIGEDPNKIPDSRRARVLEIMTHEDVSDPLEAYERAVMEEDSHGTEAGQIEPAPEKIPGWDDVDDTGEASGAGRAAAPEPLREGAGGSAGPRAGGADAGGPRQARGIADFKKFGETSAPVENPDLAVASKLAEQAPEPGSIDTVKAPSAAEAAAIEANKLLDDILPRLSEDERKVLEDALNQQDLDNDARAQILREGATCLAEASAGLAA
jgi:hypothetical protein